MKKMLHGLAHVWAKFRTCRFCGYSGGIWPDSDECPNCGEVN